MSKTTEQRPSVPSVTSFEEGLQTFFAHLLYAKQPGARERFEGDHRLLGLLFEAQRTKTIAIGRPPTLRELGEETVRATVETVETERFGTWRLEGDESEDIFDRLDAHFRPQLEAAARRLQERDETIDRIVRDSEKQGQEAAASSAQREAALWGLPTA